MASARALNRNGSNRATKSTHFAELLGAIGVWKINVREERPRWKYRLRRDQHGFAKLGKVHNSEYSRESRLGGGNRMLRIRHGKPRRQHIGSRRSVGSVRCTQRFLVVLSDTEGVRGKDESRTLDRIGKDQISVQEKDRTGQRGGWGRKVVSAFS